MLCPSSGARIYVRKIGFAFVAHPERDRARGIRAELQIVDDQRRLGGVIHIELRMIAFDVDPQMDSLRGEPRFAELRARLNPDAGQAPAA